MIKIGVTGKDSYIGNCFKNSLKEDESYDVIEIDTINQDMSRFDYSNLDIIFHVAGIAHKKETKENAELYYKVNRDLAYKVAMKAKKDGVKQFIFMSSMSVYGLINSNKSLTVNTLCCPNTYYGKSKLEAENLLIELSDNDFKVCILRPPMVYGKDSPGNLTKLIKFVKKIHIFPKYYNQRSSISIEKLVDIIKNCIVHKSSGIFLPQDEEYLCTYSVIRNQMEKDHVSVVYTSIFNPIIKMLIGKSTLITKVFGNLVYEKD